MLGRVERLHVDADEPPVGILEQRPGPGGEIGEPRADADDHVRLRRERVGRAGPGDADRAHGQGMVGRRRRLAGLRLGDRNAALWRRSRSARARRRNRGRRRRRSTNGFLACFKSAAASSTSRGSGAMRRGRCTRSSKKLKPDSRRPRSARPGRRRGSPARTRPDRSAPRPPGSAPARSARAA